MKICENVFETTCRLCLSHGNTENMVCLTDATNDDTTAEDDALSCYGTYGKAVSNLPGISITNDLPALVLPEKMCEKCFYDLKQATIFKRRCESSNDLLIKFVHNHLSCTTTTLSFKDKLCEYLSSLPETCKNTCSSKTLDNSETVESVVDNNVSGDELSDYEEIEYLSPEYLVPELSLESLLDMNEQDTEIGKEIKKKVKDNKIKYDDHSYAFCNQTDKAVCDNNPQSSDVNMSDFISVSEKPLVTKSEKGEKKQVEHKVCDEWNSDSDFYWPDTDGEKAKTEQQLTESLNRKDKQRKAVKQKILNLDILTNSEKKKVVEYQPDEDSSVMSDSNWTSENDDRVINYFSNTTTFQCNICLKVFSDTKYLITHMKRCHTEEKNHICDRCAMKFWSKAELRRHKVHKHELKTYKCEMCDFKCATKEQLVPHKRMHTGERPYKCDKCEMTYHRSGSLLRHKKHHSVKTIQCPQCPKRCHTKFEIISHFNSIHHRMYRYDCSVCDATYALSFSLRNHLTEKHGIARKDQGEIKKIELVSGHPENIMENLSKFLQCTT